MKITPITLLAALGLSASVTASFATDFYVQPQAPGPVQGAPLGVVTLQGGVADPAGPVAKAPAAAAGEAGNKWISLNGPAPAPAPIGRPLVVAC